MHNGDCQFEYVTLTANIARLRALEPWTRRMDNLWRLAHIEDGNSALPVLFQLVKQATRNICLCVGHLGPSFLHGWMEVTQELQESIEIILPFAQNAELQLKRLFITTPLEDTELFGWLEEGQRPDHTLPRTTLETFRNRAAQPMGLQ